MAGLEEAGMITHDLTPEEVGQALAVKGRHPGLSANDCFCLVTARAYPGILLTGDALLRRVAAEDGLRVHGVLWVVDELEAEAICARFASESGAQGVAGRRDGVPAPTQNHHTRLDYLAEVGPRRGRLR